MSAHARVLLLASWTTACATQVPATHYYSLVTNPRAATEAARAPAAPPIAVAPFDVAAAYETDLIAYKTNRYRLDYYDYHRWSAPPSQLVSDALRVALERTGSFERVTTDTGAEGAVLRGHVSAISEVDATAATWFGELDVELVLVAATTGRVLWSQTFFEREPMPEKSPEGLARALSVALGRIVAASTGPLREAATGNGQQG